METKYFAGCINPDSVRARYLELVKAGSDLVEVNKQLQAKLESMHGKTYTGTKKGGETYQFTFKMNQEQEDRFRNAINALVDLKMPNVEINLLGSWLWIEGDDSKPYKEQLRELGCRFNGKRTRETGRGVWNWTLHKYKKRFNSNMSRSELGEKYQEQHITA